MLRRRPRVDLLTDHLLPYTKTSILIRPKEALLTRPKRPVSYDSIIGGDSAVPAMLKTEYIHIYIIFLFSVVGGYWNNEDWLLLF